MLSASFGSPWYIGEVHCGGSLSLVGLRKNKRTSIWEYRRVVPKQLRPFHDSNEFKRSTGTDNKRDAERLALPLIAQFKTLIDGLEEAAKQSTPEVRAAVPRSVPLIPQPADLRALAGELAQALLAKHLMDPAPIEASRGKEAVRPGRKGETPPWGNPGGPWAYDRFMLLAPKEDSPSGDIPSGSDGAGEVSPDGKGDRTRSGPMVDLLRPHARRPRRGLRDPPKALVAGRTPSDTFLRERGADPG